MTAAEVSVSIVTSAPERNGPRGGAVDVFAARDRIDIGEARSADGG